ncbi:hypothetical protein [Methylobacterium sp. ID0610]|uniref:hypothetical protein n=1 Tax=Methylobacterium carpenticola TaxID=3344827 RepID=UPI00369B4A23
MAVKAAEREGKRSPLNMRTTAKLRNDLEKQASKHGRSLAQEVEARLEKSFEEDELLNALLGLDTHAQLLLRVIAATIRRIEKHTGQRYVDDYETLWHCRKGIDEVLRILLGLDYGEPPPKDGEQRSEIDRDILHGLGRAVALTALRDFGLVLSGPGNLSTPVQLSQFLRSPKEASDNGAD